jgi:hypothetical protein
MRLCLLCAYVRGRVGMFDAYTYTSYPCKALLTKLRERGRLDRRFGYGCCYTNVRSLSLCTTHSMFTNPLHITYTHSHSHTSHYMKDTFAHTRILYILVFVCNANYTQHNTMHARTHSYNWALINATKYLIRTNLKSPMGGPLQTLQHLDRMLVGVKPSLASSRTGSTNPSASLPATTSAKPPPKSPTKPAAEQSSAKPALSVAKRLNAQGVKGDSVCMRVYVR